MPKGSRPRLYASRDRAQRLAAACLRPHTRSHTKTARAASRTATFTDTGAVTLFCRQNYRCEIQNGFLGSLPPHNARRFFWTASVKRQTQMSCTRIQGRKKLPRPALVHDNGAHGGPGRGRCREGYGGGRPFSPQGTWGAPCSTQHRRSRALPISAKARNVAAASADLRPLAAALPKQVAGIAPKSNIDLFASYN